MHIKSTNETSKSESNDDTEFKDDLDIILDDYKRLNEKDKI